MPARSQKGNKAAGKNMPPPKKGSKKGGSTKTPAGRSGKRY